MAIGHLYTLLGEEAVERALPFLGHVDAEELRIVKQQIERGINTPLTSSCGRLFDAVAALLGFQGQAAYEGQAAVQLEMMAYDGEDSASYPFSINEGEGGRVIQLADTWGGILEDLRDGVPDATMALRFHQTVVQMIVEMCRRLAEESGLNRVALSGGCFQNRLLLTESVHHLEEAGFEALTHSQVPCNDGGVSLGQAVIANRQASLGE
jgi:hydrogenase maturation protein HypF